MKLFEIEIEIRRRNVHDIDEGPVSEESTEDGID